ncbi:MAG: hypothetical protein ACYDAG_18935, partial [Chloroflexota bacterium]
MIHAHGLSRLRVETAIARPRPRNSRRAALAIRSLAACAVFGLYLAASRAAGTTGLIDDHAAARTVRAWMTLFGATPGLGPTTRAGAPLPLLLQLPLLALPALRSPGWSAGIVSCGMAVVLLSAVAKGLETFGLKRWERLLLVALCALQPLLVANVATGAGAVTTAALIAWATVLIIRWSAADRAFDLILSAFALGLACLAGWWSFLLGLAVLAVLRLSPSAEGGTSRSSALALAYATPVAAIVMAWALVAWLAGGNPFGAPASAGPALPGLASQQPPGGTTALYILAVSCGFCLLPALVAAARTRRPLELTLVALQTALLIPPILTWLTGRPVTGSE